MSNFGFFGRLCLRKIRGRLLKILLVIYKGFKSLLFSVKWVYLSVVILVLFKKWKKCWK